MANPTPAEAALEEAHNAIRDYHRHTLTAAQWREEYKDFAAKLVWTGHGLENFEQSMHNELSLRQAAYLLEQHYFITKSLAYISKTLSN